MKRLGAVIVDPADIETPSAFEKTELEVLLYEFKTDLNLYLADAAQRARADARRTLIAFNEKNRDTGDALLRPGDLRDGGEEGPADGEGVPRRARRMT